MEHITEKIAKLLAKAKSTDSQSEADALMSKAIKMMLEYNISEMDVTAAQNEITEKTSKYGAGWKQRLKNVIYQHNHCTITKGGKKMTVYGNKTDIAVSEFMYNFYATATEKMAEQKLQGHPDKRTLKLDYCKGVLAGLVNRLRTERKAELQQPATIEMIHIKQSAVSDYVEQKLGKLKVTSSAKMPIGDMSAFAAGYTDSQNMRTGSRALC